MITRRAVPVYGDSKHDGAISPPASLSSASIDTLDDSLVDSKEDAARLELNEPDDNEDEVPMHYDYDETHDNKTGDLPPSYEYATSSRPSASSSTPHPHHEADGTDLPVMPDLPDYPAPPATSADKDTSYPHAISIMSNETRTEPYIATGRLYIQGTCHFRSDLTVRKKLRVNGTLIVDGNLRVGGDVQNFGAMLVAQTSDICGKFKNSGHATFARHVVQHGTLQNRGTLTYAQSLDMCGADVKNQGVVNVTLGVTNLGKVKNQGPMSGFGVR